MLIIFFVPGVVTPAVVVGAAVVVGGAVVGAMYDGH